jgi:Arc-like DNA binding domain
MPRRLALQVKARAEAERRSISSTIRNAVEDSLARHKGSHEAQQR